jgi:hypothetical protein
MYKVKIKKKRSGTPIPERLNTEHSITNKVQGSLNLFITPLTFVLQEDVLKQKQQMRSNGDNVENLLHDLLKSITTRIITKLTNLFWIFITTKSKKTKPPYFTKIQFNVA